MAADPDTRARKRAVRIGHFLDVAARGKGASFTRQNDAANGQVGIQCVARGADLGAVTIGAEGVHGIGAIEAEDRDRAADFSCDDGHANSPISAGRGRAR